MGASLTSALLSMVKCSTSVPVTGRAYLNKEGGIQCIEAYVYHIHSSRLVRKHINVKNVMFFSRSIPPSSWTVIPAKETARNAWVERLIL